MTVTRFRESGSLRVYSDIMIQHLHNTIHSLVVPSSHEKISNIVKQFKLSASRVCSNLKNLHVKNSQFSCYIERFTFNTFVMIVVSDKSVFPAAVLANIGVARQHFESLNVGSGATL